MNKPAKKTEVVIKFDYDVLEFQNRTVVQQRTGEIRECLRRSAQDIWEIGQKLTEVRSRLKHGQFDLWLKVEFNWSRRTAYNFINVYKKFRERANFAQIDIAASALYLLAAPSTPQGIRDEYLQQAREGKKVTHQDLQKAIKRDRFQSTSASPSAESPKPVPLKPEVITLIPETAFKASQPSVAEAKEQQSAASIETMGHIQPGWYYLEKQHLLFCGDTALSQFSKRIPQAALAVAITSNDWDHDWLIERARTVILLPEADLKENLVERLLLMFSSPGEAVVFPWLPSQDMIAVAHDLGRQVFAGDPTPERCDQAIAYSGLKPERASFISTLVE